MFKNMLQNKVSSVLEQKAGHFLLRQAESYTRPICQSLDRQIDSRLVSTFYNLFVTILMFRNRSMGLLLSELGGYICGFAHAPAGTKRISNLLRSKKWKAKLIDTFLFNRTIDRVKELEREGKRPLLLWDDSRIEKHESWVCEGLCSVLSSKAKRLTRIRRGFFSPPKERICVPGFQWTGVFLSHLGGIPSVIRWKKNHLLVHAEKGTKKTHLLARSFKAKASKIVRDKVRQQYKRVTISWAPVTHVEYPDNQLFIIIVRDKKNYNGPMCIDGKQNKAFVF